MKRAALAATALTLIAAPALAADIGAKPVYKAPPVAQPGYNWTGFYLFGGGGYGLLASDQQGYSSGAPITYNFNSRRGGRGYFGTVGGGYDWQFGTSWVAGIFADAQFGDIKGTVDLYDNYYVGQTKNKANYAAGARLGYLIAPNALSYVNAGYTHAEFSKGDINYYTGSLSYQMPKQSYDGWFIGGGVENSLDLFGIAAPGWFMKTEYRVARYDSKRTDVLETNGSLSGYAIATKPTVQTVSTSLVYRFNSVGVASAPVARPPVAPVRWTGFYLAGGGGYGQWAADNQTLYSGAAYVPSRAGGRGYFGTVGGGYDYQINATWVAGLFVDAQFGDIKGTFATYPDGYDGTTKNKTNYAAGVRLGYLVAPNVLSYVNGGYSRAEFTGSGIYYDTYLLPKQHYDGWFVGGGVENSLNFLGVSAPGWFMKTEYRLAQYAPKTIAIDYASGVPISYWSMSFKPYVQTVSTSLVYRFDAGAPLSAKY